ncbi:MBL fold metallo-hydrolase [Aquabacterium sp. J223]|uniref:MBL fold metallo-hydrolase n=1 Tax=Aquabacterium sp. J223 TaxID=2898431 RepID=UPI0021ADDADF|nr:MBL fold metallo-hydrolase [Aquabacterium sp. J223]UUX96399.1 MBL fold metallo-hydrolase [Aquabacterium sp. J223]
MTTYTKGLHELGNGAWAWLQPDGGFGLSNAGLITDGDECLLVDTLTNLPLTQEMLDGMRAQIPAARHIGTVLNTHAHPDHTAGNLLLQEAEIIASVEAAAEMLFIDGPDNPMKQMLQHWQRFGEAGQYMHEVMGRFGVHTTEQRMPTRTFDQTLTLSVGNKTVELIKVGPAHTRGDVVAYVPADRLVFTGDVLFHEVHPLLFPGGVDSWLAACDRILSWDVEQVVPGHGPLTDKRGVQGLKDYIAYFRTEARKRFDAGLPYEEAARDIALDAFGGWADEERILGNVHTFYVEFGATPRPLLEVMAESGRYRRLKLAGCARHGAHCPHPHD